MARPQKIGLDYFPLDCSPDKKLKAIIRKFGAEGFGVVVGLFQHVYSEGYFVKWTNDFAEDFALEMNVDECVLDDVLSFCIKREMFNAQLFKTKKILTSTGIQKRYLLATERRKCSQINHHNLINVDNNSLNAGDNEVNDIISTQSKVKKSKVKEKKELTPVVAPLKFNPKKYIDDIDWIDNDLWIEWIDHKKKVKASITERALKANVKTLEKFGKDKASFNIEKALEKNWKDFYIENNDLFGNSNKHELEGQVIRSKEPLKTAPFNGDY